MVLLIIFVSFFKICISMMSLSICAGPRRVIWSLKRHFLKLIYLIWLCKSSTAHFDDLSKFEKYTLFLKQEPSSGPSSLSSLIWDFFWPLCRSKSSFSSSLISSFYLVDRNKYWRKKSIEIQHFAINSWLGNMKHIIT